MRPVRLGLAPALGLYHTRCHYARRWISPLKAVVIRSFLHFKTASVTRRRFPDPSQAKVAPERRGRRVRYDSLTRVRHRGGRTSAGCAVNR